MDGCEFRLTGWKRWFINVYHIPWFSLGNKPSWWLIRFRCPIHWLIDILGVQHRGHDLGMKRLVENHLSMQAWPGAPPVDILGNPHDPPKKKQKMMSIARVGLDPNADQRLWSFPIHGGYLYKSSSYWAGILHYKPSSYWGSPIYAPNCEGWSSSNYHQSSGSSTG